MESASLKFLLLKIEFIYNTFLLINYELKKKIELGESQIPENKWNLGL